MAGGGEMRLYEQTRQRHISSLPLYELGSDEEAAVGRKMLGDCNALRRKQIASLVYNDVMEQ